MTETFFTQGKDYTLGMPHLSLAGLSENWFLKEFGDHHWNLISGSLGISTDKLVDHSGERLYASFVRIKWESDKDLSAFKENDPIRITSEISRFGNKMFFSEQELTGAYHKIRASLMTVFSARATDNTELQKSAPVKQADEKTITHKELPEFAKGFLQMKSNLSDTDKSEWWHTFAGNSFKVTSHCIAQYTYQIDPFSDINGVGLLYFASYPMINDRCERKVFNEILDIEDSDWTQSNVCLSRDIFYFGNANPKDELVYELNHYEFLEKNKIQISSSIYRKADRALISKQFVVREFKKEWTAEIEKHSDEQTRPFVQQSEKIEDFTENRTCIERTELIQKIGGILSEMLGGVTISSKTDLSLLGIESILFMELSEQLNIDLNLNTNPSKFYGAQNCEEIADIVLNRSGNTVKAFEIEKEKTKDEIAIVATSFKLPGANTAEAFWEILKSGESVIGSLPEGRWEWPKEINPEILHKGIDKGGFITGLDEFDPSFFSISPLEAELMDPQQRLLLQLSWELFERAAYHPDRYRGKDIGVFIGASGSDYEQLSYNSTSGISVTGSASALLSNRISYFFDLKGPSKTVDTACSSSLVALHDAILALQAGICTQAIVGGVHLMCNSAKTISYYTSKMLSEDGKCSTFDQNANGYVRAEGAVLFLLKPLSEAVADNDEILGTIKGSAVNHGGRVSGITVPNPKQQSELVIAALKNANLTMSDLSYLEAHGTGTSLGDPIEINGLNDVANKMNGEIRPNSCGLGSVKSNIGHLEAASGLVGVLKVLLAMKHRQIPPTINYKQLNPKIDLHSGPFYIQQNLQKWVSENENNTLFAGVSNFGVGGTNAHVIIGSHIEQERIQKVRDTSCPLLFVLSAVTAEALRELAGKLKKYILQNENTDLQALSATLQMGRAELGQRIAVVSSEKEELMSALEDFEHHNPNNRLVHGKANPDTAKVLPENADWDQIAAYWVAGGTVDWKQYISSNIKWLTDLPVYPFAKERYWIPGSKKDKVKNYKSHEIYNYDRSCLTDELINCLIPDLAGWINKDFGLLFPELIRGIFKDNHSGKQYILKNVFWTEENMDLKSGDQVPLRIIRKDEAEYFEFSKSGKPLFFGEMHECNREDDYNKINSWEEKQLNQLDSQLLNRKLQTVHNPCRILEIHAGKNSFDGIIEVRTGTLFNAFQGLWTIRKILASVNSKTVNYSAEPKDLLPYFSEEINIKGDLNPLMPFKIKKTKNSYDFLLFNSQGIMQFAFKGVREGEMITEFLYQN
ncbi:Pnap_2097 family protein [Chryseobacterium sp. BIGb0232]|uniref:Pnap_2097 family protein n=1 Tax=Chryseobacterium sp. BIGb0232 TaxID=2940598 RepID=UPI000F4A90FD|nr:Pnap_2097 family protein [Chryseobacterium sp. BIGb0232]MCS4301884.1 putative biosynthetic protein (TIGR04098 family) [Chryseobacterium sp. BIGb0232]ROS17831.1 putative biosynthetic protein (TIGR04099 family) [Chryseobacterium nakagawai]